MLYLFKILKIYKVKMTKLDFDNHLKELRISKKNLAKILNLPYGTVNNWNGENKPFPSWLDSWFFHYEKSLKYDKLISLIKKK